jgi:NTP pyrophosphatase (non-canonical NTP hydrolase)
MTPLELMAAELRDLVAAHHEVTGDRIALHAAEECGEVIGAYNKLGHRYDPGTVEAFAQEWAQAMLMMMMLGQHLLTGGQLEIALVEEMAEQRRRWAARDERRAGQ